MTDFMLFNTYSKKGLSKKDKIKASKFDSEISVYDDTSVKKCLICGKEVKGFCKSHSLPKFVLKIVSNDGNLRTGKTFQSDSYKDKSGVNNTLTFHCICDKCDNEFFQNYEHEELFYDKLSEKAINEIAIKSFLRYYYKQLREVAKFKKCLKDDGLSDEAIQFYANQLFLSEFNVSDTRKKINKYVNRVNSHSFYLIDEIDLDYSVDIAYQGFITLTYGFNGLINNVYNYNSAFQIQQLGLCIFPHSKGTKILLFCEEGFTRLKSFYRTYRTLTLNQKLYVINYLLLLYDEEWVLRGDFKTKLNKETLELINQRDTAVQFIDDLTSIYTTDQLIQASEHIFELKTNGNIYNFLKNYSKKL